MKQERSEPCAASAARTYSRHELVSDAVLHWAALACALAAVPVLIVMTALWRGSDAGLVGVTLYGVTLIVMLGASLAYNHLPRQDWTELLKRIDHSAIYLKIAGTYTPFALLSGAGGTMLAVIWTVAVVASVGNFVVPRRPLAVGIGICLGMGWAVLIGGQDLLARISTPVLVLMLVGGSLYTLGTLFLVMDRWRFHNTIWHGFVVVASTLFFVAVFLHVAQTA